MALEKYVRNAVILSLVIPGLGQIYNRNLTKGVFFLLLGAILAFSMLFVIGVFVYPVFLAINVYDAFTVAKQTEAVPKRPE